MPAVLTHSRDSEAGFGFATEGNGGRDSASARFNIRYVSRWRIQVSELNQTSTIPLTRRLIRRSGVITVSCWIVLAATTAVAQQSAGTVTESTSMRRDLNGRDAVSEKVVTHRTRTDNEERIVIETYLPLEYADRLALKRRVRRVTTVTEGGSQTIEETEERNPVSPSEPLSVVQRSLTTVRKSGDDSYVSERQIFEPDGNGRFVLVRKQSEQTSRD
jgi:hypothetical protein